MAANRKFGSDPLTQSDRGGHFLDPAWTDGLVREVADQLAPLSAFGRDVRKVIPIPPLSRVWRGGIPLSLASKLNLLEIHLIAISPA